MVATGPPTRTRPFMAGPIRRTKGSRAPLVGGYCYPFLWGWYPKVVILLGRAGSATGLVRKFADAVAAVCRSSNHRTHADQVARERSGKPGLDEGLMQLLVGPLTPRFGAKATQQHIVRR